MDLKGSLERAYEQMVNDLQGMLQLVEMEACRCGLVPDPAPVAAPGASDEMREGWWRAAEQFGIDTSKSDQSQAPGRWRRLALYGHLNHELATSLVAWSDSRNLLQHAYAQRTDTRGHEVWTTMQALRARVEEVVDATLAMQSRCVSLSS